MISRQHALHVLLLVDKRGGGGRLLRTAPCVGTTSQPSVELASGRLLHRIAQCRIPTTSSRIAINPRLLLELRREATEHVGLVQLGLLMLVMLLLLSEPEPALFLLRLLLLFQLVAERIKRELHGGRATASSRRSIPMR